MGQLLESLTRDQAKAKQEQAIVAEEEAKATL